MEESCTAHLNKKQKKDDSVVDNIQENRPSVDNMNQSCKDLIRISTIDWVFIVSSDWLFDLILLHLTLIDIARLDLAICNRKGRPQWFERLKKSTSALSLKMLDSVVWNDTLIDWIIMKNLHICELGIEKGYSQISNEGMHRLAQQCPGLKRIKLSINETIEDEQILDDDKRLQYLIATSPKLECIELLNEFVLSTQDLVRLEACEQLESITIQSCDLFMIAANNKILCKNKKKLKYLELGNYCDSELLLELGTNCPLLEHLNIDHLENPLAVHFEVFTQGCTKLKTLQLYNISDHDFSPVVDLHEMLIQCTGNNCHLLESFIMRSHHETSYISDVALKSLAQGCPLLNTFKISSFARISAQGVKHLADHCLMLADISLVDSEISDNVLIELGKMKSLKKLNIRSCEDITDDGIEFLVCINNSNLEYLDISYCNEITDDSVSTIREHCPNLHILKFECEDDEGEEDDEDDYDVDDDIDEYEYEDDTT